jgi:hypothetical protein
MEAPDELAPPHGWVTSEGPVPGVHRGAVVALRGAAGGPRPRDGRDQPHRPCHAPTGHPRCRGGDLHADGVARHWIFDGARRTVSTRPGSPPRSTARCALRRRPRLCARCCHRTASAKWSRAFKPRPSAGSGNFLVFLWFYALTRRIAPIGRQHRRRRPLPHPYLAHDPSSPSASCITVEAPQRELDREWHAAWEQRPKLLILRVASGEPTQQFSKAYCHNQPSGSQRPCPGVAALYLGQNHQAG